MIAAAYADGSMDSQERGRIQQRLDGGQLTDEEKAVIEEELRTPWSLSQIASQVTDVQTAEEVYAASAMAIVVDTKAERDYLTQLAAELKLDPETVHKWRRVLGVG